MINALNILVHIPMINLNFPANMQIFMSFFLDVTNFNLVPNDFIYDLFDFTPTDPLNTNFLEVDIFYFITIP